MMLQWVISDLHTEATDGRELRATIKTFLNQFTDFKCSLRVNLFVKASIFPSHPWSEGMSIALLMMAIKSIRVSRMFPVSHMSHSSTHMDLFKRNRWQDGEDTHTRVVTCTLTLTLGLDKTLENDIPDAEQQIMEQTNQSDENWYLVIFIPVITSN